MVESNDLETRLDITYYVNIQRRFQAVKTNYIQAQFISWRVPASCNQQTKLELHSWLSDRHNQRLKFQHCTCICTCYTPLLPQ